MFDASISNDAQPNANVSVHRSPVAEAATRTPEGLIAPHGGKLINLMLADSEKAAAIASCNKTMECSDRNACDVELLTVG